MVSRAPNNGMIWNALGLEILPPINTWHPLSGRALTGELPMKEKQQQQEIRVLRRPKPFQR